ncbi:MAG: glycosyltransferase [Elusimicrobia bacterium]|nr:glycosyltransferase [Elusimicrobiota bacterium]
MKVLHVSDADDWTGGCGQMMALAQGLAERGWESSVACRPGSALAKASDEAKIPAFKTGLRQDYDLHSAWQLAGFLSREGVDVLHAHHSRSHGVCLLAQAILQARGLRRPVLVVSRRVSFKPSSNPFSLLKYRAPFNDAFAAVAGAVRDVLVANGVPSERVVVIHSGVDADRFAPRPSDPEVRRSLGLPEGCPAVGKVANYSAWKGQACFLEAASLLVREGRKVHFVLVGRDTDGPEMRREVGRLGLEGRVTLAGFRKDMPEVLACLSVSVNAAVGGEGLSGTVRESLAMGIPALASDVAGNREILGSETAKFLFPAGDAEALAERLRWTLDHRDEARAAGRVLGERVRAEFSAAATVDKTEKLYRTLVDGRSESGGAEVRSGILASMLKALILATAHAGLLLALVLGGMGLSDPDQGGKFGLATAAAFVLIPQLLGLAAGRWLALPLWAALAGVLAPPLAALAAALSVEPKLFMEVVASDGGGRHIFFPDPAWKWAALLWAVVAGAACAAGWVMGLLWRRWPSQPLTKPPA